MPTPWRDPIPPAETFEPMGFEVTDWQHPELGLVRVLHREPFRMRWFATKLVTFAFLAQWRPPDCGWLFDAIESYREYVRTHKRTRLWLGVQCAHLMLPFYVSTGFAAELQGAVRTQPTVMRAEFHVPTLVDTAEAKVVTLESYPAWGTAYHDYMRQTVADISAELVP
jgi:hypothetical protein